MGRGRAGIAVAVVAAALSACASDTDALVGVCESLGRLTDLDRAVSLTEDAGQTVAVLGEIEPVMPDSHVDDVRSVRRGLEHVLALADRHGAEELSGLPESSRAEAAEVLRDITSPAHRIEDFRQRRCG